MPVHYQIAQTTTLILSQNILEAHSTGEWTEISVICICTLSITTAVCTRNLNILINSHCVASVWSAFKCTYHQSNGGHIPHILLTAQMSCHFSLHTRRTSTLDTKLLSSLRCSCYQLLFMFLDELLNNIISHILLHLGLGFLTCLVSIWEAVTWIWNIKIMLITTSYFVDIREFVCRVWMRLYWTCKIL